MAPSKVGNQIRIVSYYTPESVDKLKQLTTATRIPQSVFMREALEDLLKKHAGTLRKAAK